MVIIGGLMALIVPRLKRANIEAKYMVIRQNASELAQWGMEWGNRQLEHQPVEADCNLDAYISTLADYVGNPDSGNWIEVNAGLSGAGCRNTSGGIEYSVSEILPPESDPRNPFTGMSYLNAQGGNDGSRVVPGLLYVGVFQENDADGNIINHYYLVFTGTDSQSSSQWHAGMGAGLNPFSNLSNLRNGIFMARLVE